MDKFQSMVEKTRVLIQKEIGNKDNRPDFILEKQPYLILEELNKVKQVRDIHLFHPYYPEGTADSWDCSNPLAIRLLELLESYQESQ